MLFESHTRVTYSARNRFLLIVGHLVAGAALAALLAMLFGWVIAVLWNHILPSLLGTRPIGYWQSVGLLVMARILVGGFHHGRLKGHGNGHASRGRTWADYDEWWRESGQKSFKEFSKED
jgi:hypothetical protein